MLLLGSAFHEMFIYLMICVDPIGVYFVVIRERFPANVYDV